MSDDDFLSRWSRRKRDVAKEEASVDEVSIVPASDPAIPEPETLEEEEALLKRLNLPVPESMQPGDDFSAFMADGVPEFLRKRALRLLWRSNPVLANLDGLNDYDDDFTSPELTQKVLATAYQVGRGIVSKVTQEELKAEDVADEEPSPTDLPDADQVAEIQTEMPTSLEPTEHNDGTVAITRPRRMRFKSKTD